MKNLLKALFFSAPLLSFLGCAETKQKEPNCIDSGSKDFENIDNKNSILYYKGEVYTGCLTRYYKNGQLESKTNYKDGRTHGEMTNYYENGELLSKFNLKEGKMNGEEVWYRPNKQLLRRGNHKDGIVDGEWIEYDEEGKITLKEKYIDGEKVESSK